MSRLSEVTEDALRKLLGNRILNWPNISINAAGAASVKTASEIQATIGGVTKRKAALANQSMAITHRFDGTPVTAANPAYVQPAQTTVFYVLCINAAGTIAVVQGCYAGQAITFAEDPSKVLVGDGAIPAEPDGYTAFAVAKVTTAAATTFTPGTTALDAAGITMAVSDVSVLPITL